MMRMMRDGGFGEKIVCDAGVKWVDEKSNSVR